jgi:uncharacterized protein with HEPN domain
MSDRPVGVLLEDMLERIDRIARYRQGLDRDAFVQDDKTIDAVVRSLEVIGEAARRLPAEFKARHGEIPWHQIAGLRNRIVHSTSTSTSSWSGRLSGRSFRDSKRH